MFAVAGLWKNDETRRIRSVLWDDGRLFGNGGATDRARERAQELEGTAVGPEGGPKTTENHLAQPHSALFIILDQFDPQTVTLEGEIPIAPPVLAGDKA